MRLNSLSLKGFKSFADETIVNFNENLIGIVGPNGSGKSNIVDAIRWVLGEQKTSELRLESMSDVLFNGTKTRKEGRVARATLTFDNTKKILPTDYNQVSISRILYRDGSSEYRLNDVTCRKKDITSLFIDSGIGSNSYAIISLNMVEDILHDNGGSRRYMIEQAAGISKYKIRKKETQSKLKSTREDLDRINDLLYEIEKNMASFERQAKRTERFNNLKSTYKDISLQVSSIEVNSIQESCQQLNKNILAEKDLKIQLETGLNKLEAQIEKLKKEILESELSLNKDQKLYNELIELLGQKENSKNLLNQRIINSKDQIVTKKKSIQEEQEKTKTTSDKMELISDSITTVSNDLSELKSKAKVLIAEYNDTQTKHQELRQKENLIKSEAAQHQQVVRSAQIALESVKTEKQLTDRNIDQLKFRIDAIETSNEPLILKESELAKKAESANGEYDQLEEKSKVLSNKIEQANQNLTYSRSVLQNKKLENSSIQQRVKFLANVIEKNEGVPQSVAFLISELNDVVTLSDIIAAKEEKLTPIIELFFQDKLHYIIVSDRAIANKMLSMVREAQKGKVQFLILSELNTKTPPSDHNQGSHLRLMDQLSFPDEYNELVSHLTEGVIITEEDNHIEITSDSVTVLNNKLYQISTNASLLGGSNTLFEGVQMGKKQLLEKLISQSEQITGELDEMTVELKTKNDRLILAQNKLKSNRIDINKASQRSQNIDKELYQIKSQLSNQKGNLEQLKTQLQELSEKSKLLSEKSNEQEAEIESLIQRKAFNMSDEQLSLEIGETYKKLNELAGKRDEANRDVYQKENQLQLLKKDLEFQKASMAGLERSISSNKNTIAALNSQIQDLESQNTKTKEELSLLYKNKEELQKKLNSYEDTYYIEKGKIFELEKKRSSDQQKLYQKENLFTRLNEKVSSLKFDLQAIKDRCDIEFGINIIEYKLQLPEEVNSEELIKKRDSVQHKLRNFGEINPMAITAYNEIKERHDHISKERDDILEAQLSLEETMSEIEEAASSKFMESLDLIKVNFKKVFQGLFSADDDCDIILLDAENPLDARIEIVAKPKGKKPKSISQLSGGEKSLTAASFLFALYLLKPAPFCIFDEVDAPLDDVNVLKFNKIIKQFCKDSQFIVITHNKLTMSEVDVLYGVFLKEQGVSGVSAVDFRTYDQTEMIQNLN